MVLCFVPDCNHHSETNDCSFFRFPKDKSKKKRWIKLIRRADREPSNSSRVCSCHFRGGKERGPEVFQRNADKLFAPVDSPKPKKRQKKEPAASTTTSSEADNADLHVRPVPVSTCTNNEHTGLKVDNVLLNVQLEQTTQELNELKKTITYQRERYSLQSMSSSQVQKF